MVFNDLFKWMTLGIILAFGVTIVTHANETATILDSGFKGYNSTLTTLEGR